MGPGGKSWLAKHFEEITDAYFRYFAELDGAAQGENAGEIPDNPAPMLWQFYHQIERWNHLPEDGGLLNQPYILMHELDALDRVIQIRQQQQEAQLKAQLEAQQK